MPEPQQANEGAGAEAGTDNANNNANQGGGGAANASNGAASTKRASLEELLGSVDDDTRKAILDQVSKARKEAGDYRARLREAEPKLAEYNKLLESQKTAEQKAAEAAAAAEKRAQQAIARAVKSEIRAIASETFADPDDAATALDPNEFVDERGEIDVEAIKRELAELLERKPHWGKGEGSGPRRPAPDRSQGSSSNNRTSMSEGEQFAAFLAKQLGRKG